MVWIDKLSGLMCTSTDYQEVFKINSTSICNFFFFTTGQNFPGVVKSCWWKCPKNSVILLKIINCVGVDGFISTNNSKMRRIQQPFQKSGRCIDSCLF